MLLKEKAKNYYMLGRIAESLGMCSEAATNYFKALFAIDDASLVGCGVSEPKDHNERFDLLKKKLPSLYLITDRLFGAYRRTYTQELKKEEVVLIRKRVEEALKYANIDKPKDEEIKERFENLFKKGKIFS